MGLKNCHFEFSGFDFVATSVRDVCDLLISIKVDQSASLTRREFLFLDIDRTDEWCSSRYLKLMRTTT